ncbi:MAG TPA: hypothetical protein VJ753_07695 [Rhizomicrobium sp.]|nr:hypothetical protein [Rhizomicrobium sp.]
MGRRKWKAGQSEQADEVSFLRRFRKPFAIAVLLAAAVAFFIYRFNTSKYQYGDARTDYNRALDECWQDRTRVANSGGAADVAADACVRDTPGPASNQRPAGEKGR